MAIANTLEAETDTLKTLFYQIREIEFFRTCITSKPGEFEGRHLILRYYLQDYDNVNAPVLTNETPLESFGYKLIDASVIKQAFDTIASAQGTSFADAIATALGMDVQDIELARIHSNDVANFSNNSNLANIIRAYKKLDLIQIGLGSKLAFELLMFRRKI